MPDLEPTESEAQILVESEAEELAASKPEPLRVLSEWEDEPEDGCSADEWPYPTRYTRSEAQGELAERIRRALNAPPNLPVYVEERVESGGYSEYTQEDDYFMTIEVGDISKEVQHAWHGGLVDLLRWLDKEAPVDDRS